MPSSIKATVLVTAQRACCRGQGGLKPFARWLPETRAASSVLPACPCPAEKQEREAKQKMLMERDAAEACLAVSLHVSRAAGVEGALPVHASLSWFGEGAAEDVGPKKKVGRVAIACQNMPGPLASRPGPGAKPETNLGVALSFVDGFEDSYLGKHLHGRVRCATAAQSLTAGVTEMTCRAETGVDSRRGRLGHCS